MSLTPFSTNPVLVATPPSVSAGYTPGNGYPGRGFAPVLGPVLYQGRLFLVLESTGGGNEFTPAGGLFVFSSADNGATWSVLDAIHGPSRAAAFLNPVGSIVFDGNHTIVVAFSPTADPVNSISGPLNLQNFDLSSRLWGAVYGTSAPPSIFFISQCFQRPDGTIIVFTCDHFNGTTANQFTAHVFTAPNWSAFAVDTNVTAGFNVGSATAAMDSTGAVHLFMNANNITNIVYYQLVTPANTLGANSTVINYAESLTVSQAAVSGDNVILAAPGLNNGFATIAVGTPLSAPVFTLVPAPGIDPVALPAGAFVNPPAIAVDATGIYVAYLIGLPSGNQQVRLLMNPNLSTPATGWTNSITAFDLSLSNMATFFGIGLIDFFGISRQGGNTFAVAVNIVVSDVIPQQSSTFYFGVFSSPPPVFVQPQPAITGGLPASVSAALSRASLSRALSSPDAIDAAIAADPSVLQDGVAIGGCKRMNGFDDCALAEALRVRKIVFPPLCVMPKGVDVFSMPWDEDFGAIPEQTKPFNKTGGITTPTPIAGDQTVFSFRMPAGFDGLMTALYFNYSGSGFLQGSGDIIFRVRRNQVYLKDLSNVPYLLGTSKLPVPMTQGALLLAGQLVSVIVNVPNLSGNIQVGQSTVFGGLIGFWWPRG